MFLLRVNHFPWVCHDVYIAIHNPSDCYGFPGHTSSSQPTHIEGPCSSDDDDNSLGNDDDISLGKSAWAGWCDLLIDLLATEKRIIMIDDDDFISDKKGMASSCVFAMCGYICYRKKEEM